jgi:thymidylate synthase (FAD)
MLIIKPSIVIEDKLDAQYIMSKIEKIGRVCYKSEDKITPDSSNKFIKNILNMGHESIIEHCSLSVRVICDRGVSHEIVRHRIASYSQESTRYCNYSTDKFNNELTFIMPCFMDEDDPKFFVWKSMMQHAEDAYKKMVELGATPEEARSILPNSLKTELVMTMNLREWRHFFKLRTSKRAHPQMREVANLILTEFQKELPVIFNGFGED